MKVLKDAVIDDSVELGEVLGVLKEKIWCIFRDSSEKLQSCGHANMTDPAIKVNLRQITPSFR